MSPHILSSFRYTEIHRKQNNSNAVKIEKQLEWGMANQS